MIPLKVVEKKSYATFDNIEIVTEKILAEKTLKASVEVLRNFAYKFYNKGEGTWNFNAKKLATGLLAGEAPYNVFILKGNTKLPFASFSTLPRFTCPGAGDCLNWCYSFQAWRYPAAWCRQLQNTLLLKYNRKLISKSFYSLAKDLVVRLYVDGDFDSLRTIKFWMEHLEKRPDLKAYGYSKSWDLLYSYHKNVRPIPSNYICNLSSGGKPQHVSKNEMLKQSFIRGEFIAVPINWKHEDGTNIKKLGFKRFESKNYHAAVRQVGLDNSEKYFSCPGLCGECTSSVHACGSMKFKDIKIAIGLH